jgi:hypothetical protein
MSRRVFGVISDSVSSAEKAKPFSSRIGTGRRRAGELDHRAVDREARIGIEDLGARLAEHDDRRIHGRLAAGQDHHLSGETSTPVVVSVRRTTASRSGEQPVAGV